jgi:orotate phosphoribosyltransferase
MLATSKAVLTGHFRLLSGLHTDHFLAFSRIASESASLERISGWLAPEVAAERPDFVLAPSTAGVALGWSLARRLGVGLHLASLDDDGRPDGVIGEPDLTGGRGLLVNDIVTTGRSFLALADLLGARRAQVTCASWFMTRSETDVAALLGALAVSVLTLPLAAWSAEDCELCGAGEPATAAVDLN